MAKLYFRYGAMGSSKSANILMVRYNYEERVQYAVLLKPRTDNRDSEREIKSRMGLAAPAEYIDDFLKEISESWSETDTEYLYQGKKVDAILIDEAQFLSPEEVDTLSDIVDFYEIPVLCYGFRTDFLNHKVKLIHAFCLLRHVYDNTMEEPVRIIRKYKEDISIFANDLWSEEKILSLME